ncbi:YbgC/FadM family acyl-CoA thioesterase [Rhodobacterales bacterium]|nr:YbgC/FadM family acyl-CoA thioesterase [Rhodobacterales bacterium]
MTDWPDLAGRLEDGGHVLPVRVYYEDTDFTGAVYHGRFVNFFERARSDFLRLIDIHHTDLAKGVHGAALAFAVQSLTLTFTRPARIDDLLEVHSSFSDCRGARLKLDQLIYRGDDLIASAAVNVAVITPEGRPSRLPKHLADTISRFLPSELGS